VILDLSSILPQDHPMIMVDKLISSTENSIVVEATIKNSYPFTTESIGTWIGLEFMAQSAAVLANLDGKKEFGLGFLLGCRKFVSNVSQFTPGQNILISINIELPDRTSPLVSAFGVIKDKLGEVICEASLTLYEPKDDGLYLSNEA
jgi:predicted hotdog family 3-hydroxylacyl-ACP dehydratase